MRRIPAKFAATLLVTILLAAVGVSFGLAADGGGGPPEQGATAGTNVGTLNIGNLVQGSVMIKETPEDPSPREFQYTYMRIQASLNIFSAIQQEYGVIQNDIEAIDQYVALNGATLPTDLEILTANLPSPSAFIFYTFDGVSGFQNPTSVNGYDPIGATVALLGLNPGEYSSVEDTLTNMQIHAIPISSGGYYGTGNLTRYAGAGTMIASLGSGGETTPPVTTDDAPAGWQNSDVTVTLSCADAGSGCASTHYQVDGGVEQTGSQVVISADGEHTITYYSVDNDSNSEIPHDATVQLDKTLPSITGIEPAGNLLTDTATLHAYYADGGSGIDETTVLVTLDGVPQTCASGGGEVSCDVTGLVEGGHVIEVSADDNAGNTGQDTGNFSVFLGPDRNFYFNWYDSSQPMTSWVLMANPAEALNDLQFSLKIAGQQKEAGDLGQGSGVITPGGELTPNFPGLMGGPVKVTSQTGGEGIVSQRTLMGNSFEEIMGREEQDLSHHYYWTWYDQLSTGFTNWIMIGNPSDTDTVHVVVSFVNEADNTLVEGHGEIGPGESWAPTFPGKMGGPVELKAYLAEGTWPADGRDVVASQRVLTNFGTAFNEQPGIPAQQLSNDYVWTWYDMASPDARNWVLMVNPNPTPVQYTVTIAGDVMATGTLEAAGDPQGRDRAHPVFPGLMGGPVEVASTGGDIIASQRSLWGPSFGEVPGYPRDALAAEYHMTFYDMQSPGVLNWVLVSNPNPAAVDYTIVIDDDVIATGTLQPVGDPGGLDRATPVFPGIMGGPVRVTATGDVIASQRVLWNGYFNEVPGIVLDYFPGQYGAMN